MKLDLCSVYNLVWICRRDEWNTALCGHFECTAMFFCLMNVSLIFQHMVNDIFMILLRKRLERAYLGTIPLLPLDFTHLWQIQPSSLNPNPPTCCTQFTSIIVMGCDGRCRT